MDKNQITTSLSPEIKRLEENTGNGTFVIHIASDEVNYFINYAGGLSVQMIVKNSKKHD